MKLLQIAAVFGVITNYGGYYKLRRYYKLRCNKHNVLFSRLSASKCSYYVLFPMKDS